MNSDSNEIIDTSYEHKEIELLFKQIKQNFPLKYFYGESANVIKIQIGMILIAKLLLMVMKKGVTCPGVSLSLHHITGLYEFLQSV